MICSSHVTLFTFSFTAFSYCDVPLIVNMCPHSDSSSLRLELTSNVYFKMLKHHLQRRKAEKAFSIRYKDLSFSVFLSHHPFLRGFDSLMSVLERPQKELYQKDEDEITGNVFNKSSLNHCLNSTPLCFRICRLGGNTPPIWPCKRAIPHWNAIWNGNLKALVIILIPLILILSISHEPMHLTFDVCDGVTTLPVFSIVYISLFV